MAKTFDPICHDLAKKFAVVDSEASVNSFAAYLQDCAEWWMEEHSEEAQRRRDHVGQRKEQNG